LWAPLYASEDRVFFGFPFLYWYQLAWVPLTAALTYVVYRKTRPTERSTITRRERFRRT
jgi:hypothetical protein